MQTLNLKKNCVRYAGKRFTVVRRDNVSLSLTRDDPHHIHGSSRHYISCSG